MSELSPNNGPERTPESVDHASLQANHHLLEKKKEQSWESKNIEKAKSIAKVMGEAAKSKKALATFLIAYAPNIYADNPGVDMNKPREKAKTHQKGEVTDTPSEQMFREVKRSLPEGGMVEIGENITEASIVFEAFGVDQDGNRMKVVSNLDALQVAQFIDDISVRIQTTDKQGVTTEETLYASENNRSGKTTLQSSEEEVPSLCKDKEEFYSFDVEDAFKYLPGIESYLEQQGITLDTESTKAFLKTVQAQWQETADGMVSRYESNGGQHSNLVGPIDGTSIQTMLPGVDQLGDAQHADALDVVNGIAITFPGANQLSYDPNTISFRFGPDPRHSLIRANMLHEPIQTSLEVGSWSANCYGETVQDAVTNPHSWFKFLPEMEAYEYREGNLFPRDNGGNPRPLADIQANMTNRDGSIDTTRDALFENFTLSRTASYPFLDFGANYNPQTRILAYREYNILRDKAPSSTVDQMISEQEFWTEIDGRDAQIEADRTQSSQGIVTSVNHPWFTYNGVFQYRGSSIDRDEPLPTDAMRSEQDILADKTAQDGALDVVRNPIAQGWADSYNANSQYAEVMVFSYEIGSNPEDRYLSITNPVTGEEYRLYRDNQATGIDMITQQTADTWAQETYDAIRADIISQAEGFLNILYTIGYSNVPGEPRALIFDESTLQYLYWDTNQYLPGNPSAEYYSDHYTDWNAVQNHGTLLTKTTDIESRIDQQGNDVNNYSLQNPIVMNTGMDYFGGSNSYFWGDNEGQTHTHAYTDIVYHPYDLNESGGRLIGQVETTNRGIAQSIADNAFLPASAVHVFLGEEYSYEESSLRFAVDGSNDDNFVFLRLTLPYFNETASSVNAWREVVLMAIDPGGNIDGDNASNQIEYGFSDMFDPASQLPKRAVTFDFSRLSKTGLQNLINLLSQESIQMAEKEEWISGLQSELDARTNNRSGEEGLNFSDPVILERTLLQWNAADLETRPTEWKGMLNFIQWLDKENSPYFLGLRQEVEAKLRVLTGN